MFKGAIHNLRKMDWLLMVAVILLFCFGLAAIYSVGLSQPGSGGDNFKKQFLFGLIGLLVLLTVASSNYSSLRIYSRQIWVGLLGLLVLVLFFGGVVRGTKGWFLIGGLGIQPVELAKVGLIIILAKFFSNRLQHFQAKKHVIVSLFYVLSFAFFVMLQPDLGSTLIMFGIWFFMLFMTGVDKKYLLVLILIFIIITTLAWGFFLKDYQRQRIMVFLSPQLDPLGSGYNVSQSIIAIGSGRLFGRGLGFGSQSQLKFIPEAQTDFIFAVIAEELGLIGVLLVLGLWGLLFYRLFAIAKTARDDLAMFMVLGIAIMFFLHLLINIGMNMGVMPVMGISLPFLSYGGSFILVSFLMVGLAQSVAIRR